MAWKDMERKTRKVSFLIKQSQYDNMKKMADERNISLNEMFSQILEKLTEEVK